MPHMPPHTCLRRSQDDVCLCKADLLRARATGRLPCPKIIFYYRDDSAPTVTLTLSCVSDSEPDVASCIGVASMDGKEKEHVFAKRGEREVGPDAW